MDKENTLTILTRQFIMDVIPCCEELKSMGQAVFASLLETQALSLDFASNFAASALTKEKFISHIEDGYYSSGKIEQSLKLLDDMDMGFKNQPILLESINKIHRMFAASYKTATKNQTSKELE